MKVKTSKMKISNKKRVKFDLSRNKRVKFNDDDDKNEDMSEDNESIDANSDELVDHKQSLERLKEKDPEFYSFLKENDQQLLDFNAEDDDDNDEDIKDDEDLEDTDSAIDKLTLKQIDEWSDKLKESANIETIKCVIKAFKSAINQTRDESNFRLESSQIFNAIVNVCLIDLLPAIHKYLRLPQLSDTRERENKLIDPKKSRNWKNLVFSMKSYLSDMIKMLNTVSDNALKLTIFRHILHLVPFYLIYSHLTKKLIKEAIILWSESEEKIRVIAFLCILRIVKQQQRPMISQILKMLYITYVKNCKFTNELNWPLINFMKLGLVELYSLDDGVAYQHSFVFIKQLAINLRTAITVKKKESYKSIYNWQYLHSILFWSHLLSCLQQNDDLKSMLCPLINIIIGTIKFAPSNNYLPLRLHLVKALIKLSDDTNTFIPILPFITEILDCVDYNKKQTTNDEKALNLEVLLKVSKLNLHNLEFRNSIINKVYELLLMYTSTQSYRVGFPELVFVSIIKIKKFIKSCPVAHHCHLLKQLVEKIDENSKFVSEKRRNVIFSVKDVAIEGWERQLKDEGTPVLSFYNQWSKMRAQKEIEKSDLPLSETNTQLNERSIMKEKTRNVNKKTSKKRDNNESDGDKGNSKKTKKRKKTKRKSNVTTNIEYSIDNVFDLSSDEECND